MRTYAQYCAVAKSLDLVGDRWTLLIIRELMLRGGSRYTDLRDGLPGIATNLLVERLRELERAELVWREAAPPPIATTLYHLTPRGEALRPVLRALGHWGAALLPQASDDDAFRSHWLVLPAEDLLHDRTPDQPPVSIEVRTGGGPVTIETTNGEVRARPGSAIHPDLILTGPHRVIVRLLAGRLDVDDATAKGLTVEGNVGVLRRLQPLPAS